MDFESYLHYVEEAILVIDNSFDVVSFNSAFSSLFPEVKKAVYVVSCLESCPALKQRILNSGCESNSKNPRSILIGQANYTIQISDIHNEEGGVVIARSFVFSDVTDYEKLITASEENNHLLQKLNHELQVQKNNLESKTRMKEKVAAGVEAGAILRDLHDTLGHSFTMLNALSRLALIERKQEKKSSHEELEETLRFAKISLAELDTMDMLVIGEREKIMSVTAFLYRLKQTMAGVSLRVKLTISGKETKYHRRLFYPVTRIVQEACTNCLRHANATEFVVTVDFDQNILGLFLMDNGISLKGSRELKKNNGLIGMEERVKNFVGDIKMGITKGGGLYIHVLLPVKTL